MKSKSGQSMETAPKDGTPILVYGLKGWAGDYENYESVYGFQVVSWQEREDGEGGWWVVGLVSYYIDTVLPTMWWPLPDPPVENS